MTCSVPVVVWRSIDDGLLVKRRAKLDGGNCDCRIDNLGRLTSVAGVAEADCESGASSPKGKRLTRRRGRVKKKSRLLPREKPRSQQPLKKE